MISYSLHSHDKLTINMQLQTVLMKQSILAFGGGAKYESEYSIWRSPPNIQFVQNSFYITLNVTLISASFIT